MKIRRSTRRVVSLGTLLGLAALGLLFPIKVPAQSNHIIRPSSPPPNAPGEFSYPQNAYDASPVTASGAARSAHCHTACITPQVDTMTWSGFPGGYVPVSLVVRWSANALFSVGSSSGSVEAKVNSPLTGAVLGRRLTTLSIRHRQIARSRLTTFRFHCYLRRTHRWFKSEPPLLRR